MSVRHFTSASSEKITLSLGALGFAFGPGTVAAVIKTPAAAANSRFFSASTTIANGWSLGTNASGISMLAVTSNTPAGVTVLGNSKWYLLAGTKATGNVAPRYHIYDFAAGTWTHENSAASTANSSVPITEAKFGCSPASNLFWNGDVAALGVWNVVLTDQQCQDLLLFMPVIPKGLWRLNQDTVAENVLDLSGGGANQSAIVGTSITAVTQPVGMMNLAPPKLVPANFLATVGRAANF